MCGICGVVGEGAERAVIDAMNAAQSHRGPDGHGAWFGAKGGVALGHTRLAILDLTDGAQPMVTADQDLVVVFNGEIYNFKELRGELQQLGHVFQTHHSDTEILLHGWRQWGRDLPSKLNGMWAFVVYDVRNDSVFASRDRFGKKPFYYFHDGRTFAFASELRALLKHPRAPRNLSKLALQKFFGYGYIPSPLSAIAGIHKLPGGHSLFFDARAQKLSVERFWRFAIDPRPAGDASEADLCQEFRQTLDAATQRRLVADVPVGVFLSGGVDSSTVTWFASQARARGELKTFSIGFDEATFDESAYAKQVAELCGTHHECQHLSLESALDIMPELARALDEPLGDNSLLPTWLLCRHARRFVPVALGGDAGDELFAGYDPFLALAPARHYSNLIPRSMHEAIFWLVRKLPVSHRRMSLDFKLKRTLRGLSQKPPLWAPVWMAPLSPEELDDLFGEKIAIEELYSEAIAAWDACPQDHLLDKLTQFYIELYLQEDILAKVDRMSMAHSLEVRAPFLDIDVVNFARRLPREFKLKGTTTKYLLKKCMEPHLPKEILYRSKQGFGAPVGRWFQQDKLTVDASAVPPMMSRAFVEAKVASHRAQKSDERALLWNLWTLQSFLPHR